ncbi:hypothetical protein GCM10011375_06430 [Hymenobacter qilianensis]|uniref:Uncharacterized protein n=1 Tax=Hymenobacter qilianensis TaxID=1385715 RepID=A0ACB5PMN3_9BACT|nr:hypothetical protein GCM10011375_06430 [Hymenobacter qilianensis]
MCYPPKGTLFCGEIEKKTTGLEAKKPPRPAFCKGDVPATPAATGRYGKALAAADYYLRQ